MPRPVIRLVVKYDNMLAFPHGGNNYDGESPEYEDFDTPVLLVCLYDAGDRDSIPFPLRGDADHRNLARALFDERECNPFFPVDAIIELPDGTVFDFDALVA